MRYSRRIFNYLERITLSALTHIMNMNEHIAIDVETLKIDSRCSLEKELIKLICMNP